MQGQSTAPVANATGAYNSDAKRRPLSHRRKPPKYTDLTKAFAAYLFQYVDRYDWGHYIHRARGPRFATASEVVECHRAGLRKIPPFHLTKTHLQSHLEGNDKLYTISRRDSGFAFIMVDLDAHQGQTDALPAAEFVRDRFFPGGYIEPSKRGVHLHLLVRVGMMRRVKFNQLMLDVRDSLRTHLVANGFASTLDITGGFTIWDGDSIQSRGTLAAMPRLPGGTADLERLVNAPVYLIRGLFTICGKGPMASDSEHDASETEGTPKRVTRRTPKRDTADAWERMQWAAWEFTCIFRRIPTIDELVKFYADAFRGVATVDRDTYRRAKDAIKRRVKTFDASKAGEGGYVTTRPQLIEAVQAYCQDRANPFGVKVTDEDLAIALYVFTRVSFSVNDSPKRQFSCPEALIVAMFNALYAAGVTRRKCGDNKKPRVLKRALESAGLIECLDRNWVHAGPRHGVGQKWTIARNHWRFNEFCRFAEGIEVKYVREAETPIREVIEA